MAFLDTGMPSVAPETKNEKKEPTSRMRRYWREIEAYAKASSDWKEQGEKVVRLYLDQHRTAASPRRFALLWSNIETLKPAVYAKVPNILCSRRYKDPDPTGRTAAEMLERATNTTFDLGKVDEVLRMVRDDRLLVARGQAWIRYEADFEKVEKTEYDDEYEKVKGERACVDYVHWLDFGHNVCGVWKDVWLVWRKVHMTRAQAEKRFKKEQAEQLVYTKRPLDDQGKQESGEPTATVYELWDKRDGKVVWLSKDSPDILEDGEPPIEFRDFFPCPEPCYGSKSSKSLIPVPDYRYYQDQAQEIDDLTEKIAVLTDYLQMRGFIPAGPSSEGADAIRMMIQSMQSSLTTNKSVFVPVESWGDFAKNGGARQLIEWMPLDMAIAALQGAVLARKQLIEDVYQITGIADILRGQTDPNETLGAQQLKAQTGGRRTGNAKDDLARFAKDLGRLVAEVIAEQFSPETLGEMTNYTYQPPMMPPQPGMQVMGGNGGPPMGMPQSPMGALPPGLMPPGAPQMPAGAPQPEPGMPAQGAPSALPQAPTGPQPGQALTFDDAVIELLRNDKMRNFLIDIETDSTIQPDEDIEKQRRTEFITATGSFLAQATEIIGAAPAVTPMITEMLLFGVRGFRVGRTMEDVIERTMQQVQQQAMAPKPPSPEEIKLQIAQQEFELEKKKAALKAKTDLMALRMKQQESQQKVQMEAVAGQQEMAIEAAKGQQEMQLKGQEHQQNVQLQREEHELTAATRADEHAQSMTLQREAGDQKAEQAEQSFQQKQRQAAAAAKNKPKAKGPK